MKVAVAASGTTVTDIHGVGPIVAAILIGHGGDISRFPTAGHFASYNGTAPIEASSGPKVRHRLNPRGNRQLNHALHIAAIAQARHDTPGRAYYQRKITEGKTPKEALRALKRRISDALYKQLRADRRSSKVREDTQGRLSLEPPAFHPDSRLFGSVTPGPTRNYAPERLTPRGQIRLPATPSLADLDNKEASF